MNVKLMDKVLEQIDLHPETWNQQVWHCGTTHCIAGWAAVLEGWEHTDHVGWNYLVSKPGFPMMRTDFIAGQALGLTQNQAYSLFDAGNTRDSIDLIIDAILSGSI